MFKKEIIFCGQKTIIACDGKCDKAFGLHSREKHFYSCEDDDDFAYLTDDELGNAPISPMSEEGRDFKPINAKSGDDMNKWCARECERSVFADSDGSIVLPDLSKITYNIPSAHNYTNIPTKKLIEMLRHELGYGTATKYVEIKNVLATREHVPNAVESKKNRQELAKQKRNYSAKDKKKQK